MAIFAGLFGCACTGPVETQERTAPSEAAQPSEPAFAVASEAAATTTAPTQPSDNKAIAPTTATSVAAPAALPERPKPTTPEEAEALRRELLALLRAGRKAATEGKQAEAIAKYSEALTIEPSDPTVLGELGWAAYKAGNFQLAYSSTIQAIRSSGDAKQLGALHYNLGRIAEDQNHLAEAVSAYRTSLELRDNKTVKARLAEVSLRLPPDQVTSAIEPLREIPTLPLLDVDVEEWEEDEAEEDEVAAPRKQSPKQIAAAGLARLGSVAADLPAACTTLTQLRCADYSFGSEACSCEPTLQELAPHETQAGDSSWGLLSLRVGSNDAHVVWFPVVQTSAGWVLFSEIAWAFNPGTIGVAETVSFEPTRIEPLLAKDSPPLVFTFSKSRTDSDMALNELEQERYSAIVLCTRYKADAWCTMPLLLSYEFERDIEFPEEPGEQLEHQGLPIAKSYAATVSFSAGSLTLADVLVSTIELGRLSVAGGVLLPKGSYGLRALLGR